jgi:hypothetical protein
MYNPYSVTKSQQAVRDLVKAIRDLAGNMPSLPAIFPNGGRRWCARQLMACANR